MIGEVITNMALSHSSQDYWVQLDLMKRSEPIPVELTTIRLKTDFGGMIIDKLVDNYGYVVRKPQLVRAMYSGHVDRQALNAFCHHIGRVRPRLNQEIFKAHDIGFALGVRREDLSLKNAQILFVLKESQGRRVHAEDIACRLFREVDTQKISFVYSGVEALRRKPAYERTFIIAGDNRGYEFSELGRATA